MITTARHLFAQHRPRPVASLRGLLALGLGLWLMLWAALAQAQGVELSQLSTHRGEEGLELSFSTRFELPKPVEDALMKGVPLYFTVEASVFRNRWYWRDARAGRETRSWRLAWQPLTRQYKVSTGGLNQSYGSLPEALASLRGLAGWRIAEPKEIEDSGNYYLEFSYKLDTTQLPRPMQIGLGVSQAFGLSVERTVALNPDFSLRTPAPAQQ